MEYGTAMSKQCFEGTCRLGEFCNVTAVTAFTFQITPVLKLAFTNS